jgi:hypothetical protein
MLLITVIIGVAAMIAMPYFVKSIRGNLLRTAGRSVIMLSRYARTMAVLYQRDMALEFDMGTGAVRVRPLGAPAATNSGAEAAAALLPEPDNPLASVLAPLDGVGAPGGTEAPPPPARLNLAVSRTLEGVSIRSFELDGEDSRREGQPFAVYWLNGICTPYTVTLADAHDKALSIHVDALATPKVENPD